METKDVVYLVGILLTAALGVWNLVSNIRASRRTSYINTVTAQRVNWIEQLRQDVASFSGKTYTWCLSKLEGENGELDILKEIDRLRYVIRLRLNPSGKHDNEIERLMKEIPELTGISKKEELKAKLDELTKTTQNLLKEEWEKVKKEAKSGDINDQ